MPTKLDMYEEAYRRGILPPEKVAIYEEIKRRGLLGATSQETEEMPSKGSVHQTPRTALGGLVQIEDPPENMPEWMQKSPIGAGLYGAGKALINQAVKPAAETIGAIVGGTATGGSPAGGALGYGIAKKGMDIVSDTYAKMGGEKAPDRTVAGEIGGSAVDVGTAYGLGKAMELGGKAIYRVTEDVSSKLSKVIRSGIEKGIRPQKPSIARNMTSEDYNKYIGRAESGVKSIIGNKPNIAYSDEAGNILKTNTLPESLSEFGEAINQTKRSIVANYTELAKQAGDKGGLVKLENLVKELRKIASDPSMDVSPSARLHAIKMAKRFEKRGAYTPLQAQDAISKINSRLKAFYKNPSYEGANITSIDAMIATHLRGGTDDVISSLTGEQYQPLKNSYGSLRAIENDVNYRALTDARKNKIGFWGYADIWTAAELVSGFTNPASFAKALTIQGAKQGIKWINNPNRIVKSMFKDAEKLMAKLPPEVHDEVVKQIQKETGVYRYQPEFKGARSAIPPKIQTELQPGESPYPEAKKGLLPSQRALQIQGSETARKEQLKAGPLRFPDKTPARSQIPEQLKTQKFPSEPVTPSNLFPDQQAKQLGIKTEGTLLGPEPKPVSPLLMPNKEFLKSKIPEKLNPQRHQAEHFDPSNLFPDQASRTMRIKTEAKLLGEEPKKPMPLLKPKKEFLKSSRPNLKDLLK